jgi:hypothetical protein
LGVNKVKRLLVLGLVLVSTVLAAAERTQCTREDAMAAETEAATLKTWGAVHSSYMKYKHCDDGAIGEGYSWSVMKLLTEYWKSIHELEPFWKESGFRAFLIRHIDETYSKEEANMVVENTTRKCPPHVAHICQELNKAVQSAMRGAS